MQLTAERLSRVKASASEAASRKARELLSAGVDLISLATGEPDFDTPEHVIEAALIAMRAGQTKYTSSDGTPQLKQAIATKFARDNDLTYAPNEILASAGAKNIVFLALMASVDSGDEVIVPAPHWVSYTDMTVLVGGTPVACVRPLAEQWLQARSRKSREGYYAAHEVAALEHTEQSDGIGLQPRRARSAGGGLEAASARSCHDR